MREPLTARLAPLWRPRPPAPTPRTAIRLTEIVLGLVAVGVAVLVLANPYASVGTLIALLAISLGADALRTFLTEGLDLPGWKRIEGDIGSYLAWLRRLGRIGLGALALGLVLAVLVLPEIRQLSLLYILAFAVVTLSLDRLTHAIGTTTPRWFRASSGGAGVLSVVMVAVAVLVPSVGVATFSVLLGLSMMLSGIQSVVSGLHPTDARQLVLLEAVLFALLYGLVLINWIDLFGKTVPGYGIWLILTYFAPFWLMLVYEGFSEWALAISLGLLVSLANDVGYFFVGNLLFGFHEDLGPWILGQLGFRGGQIVTVFQGGSFALDVTSVMMGLSIYARAAVVSAGLYYWWKHPSRIVARLSGSTPDR